MRESGKPNLLSLIIWHNYDSQLELSAIFTTILKLFTKPQLSAASLGFSNIKQLSGRLY